MAFITPMGIVSLFSDMTHEGARSILGEYLNLTGASAATIGFVSGIGELCGYSLSSAMPCASASGRRSADCRAQKSSLCRRSSSTYEKALSDIPVP